MAKKPITAHGMLEISRGAMLEQRLRAWAEARADNPLASDVLEYMVEVNVQMGEALNLCKTALESRDAASARYIKTVEGISDVMSRLKNEGRYIPACKNYTFQPVEGGWTIGVPDGKPVFFYDTKGFQYIHKLLQKQSEPIACHVLAGVGLVEPDLPAIDGKTRAKSLEHLQRLQEQTNSALARGDEELAANHDAEAEEIEKYLGKNTYKGRIRKKGSDDKARQNVKKAIDAALDKIRVDCPPAFKALKINTGYECCYTCEDEWITEKTEM